MGRKSRHEKRTAAIEAGERALTEGEWEERANALLNLSDQAKKELWDENTGEYKGSQPLKTKDIVELHDCAYRLTGHGQSKVELNISMMRDIELLRAIETIIPRKLPQLYHMLSLPQGEVVNAGECEPMEAKEAMEEEEGGRQGV